MDKVHNIKRRIGNPQQMGNAEESSGEKCFGGSKGTEVLFLGGAHRGPTAAQTHCAASKKERVKDGRWKGCTGSKRKDVFKVV